MRNFFFILFITLIGLTHNAQKSVTLEEIWSGTFSPKGLQSLNPLNDGQHYSVSEFDRTTRSNRIVIYEYLSGEQNQVVFDSKAHDAFNYFDDYQFAPDEQKLLLATESQPVFRHSVKAVYWLYDTKTKQLQKLFEHALQEPTFSPDGQQIAFAYNNNLYVKNLNSGQLTQITTDGKTNEIINGTTDWVYEEELSFVRAFDWNASADKIAFIRFDERAVPEFSMDIYGKELYPTQEVFKYPKAGETNSTVSLHIYDLTTGQTQQVDLSDYSDFYIARIGWTKQADTLAALLLNRHQNQLDLYFIDGQSAQKKLILRETDKAYVEQPEMPPFLEDNSFIWASERSGFSHLYHYGSDGKLLNAITSGNWDVTDFYGFNPKTKTVYYQSVENGSINRDVYAIKINSNAKTKLSTQNGTNRAAFSADFSYFINTFSNSQTPTQYTLHDAKIGKKLRTIEDNSELLKKIAEYQLPRKEFSTLKVGEYDLNMWMIKPPNFDPNKSYPMFMYQYSGPGSQSVSNTWNGANDYWYYMLAQQGYVVVCVDGRGTGMRGSEFKKMTYLQLGKYEVEDQMNAAIELGKLPYIDESRIGIWGWSYGGFMASNAIFQGADIFKMAIAVAPVTSWRFYDTIYTERFMRTPQENSEGYDQNSPINHVKKLKGKFLLVHGMADDNVHVQNSMRMIEALVQANKDFEWAIYPDKNHGIYGGNTRLQLYKKMTKFIENNL